ncbi:hypothetical protein [Catelliglobosispora koreensis]|uniref:hypothetical protein n=1 Tax=Catelliglobosispora koreensis TaxID=129052 RepID=UPI000381CE99|nr:hypothetical protein [Catelliglobosispora koreensis]
MKSPTRAALILAAAIATFVGYFQMAKTMPINADGASNALQAWEMWHGNPILRGWTVTDVSFYSTELIEYLLITLVHGLNEDVFRIACALTYTLLVVLTVALAKGDATGRKALARMGLAAAIVLLPMPGAGYLVAFGGPNHLGTAVPLLVTWLLLDRAQEKRWMPVAVGLALVWGQIGDPLVLFIGVLPLGLVTLYRTVRKREWFGTDARLVLAAALSVPIGQGVLKGIEAAGGFIAHSPPTHFASPGKWLGHLKLLGEVTAVNYGGYLPDLSHPVDVVVGVLRLGGLGLAVIALGMALVSLLRQPFGDRVNQVLAIAIGVNLGAFVASTLPTDLMSARQVAVVLPMGAALAGRIVADHLFATKRPQIALATLLVFFGGVFVWHTTGKPWDEPKRELVAWLDGQGLHHGLGGYWNANDLTLISQGKVTVAPVTGGDTIRGLRWESRADWYDAAKFDARFIVIDTTRPAIGDVDTALKQFGNPVIRKDFEQFAVLVYDKDLLEGLDAECVGSVKPSMYDCASG